MKIVIIALSLFFFCTSAYADVRQAVTYYKNEEYEQALKEFLMDTHSADTQITYQIGYMYWMGQGTDKNPNEAIEWFIKTIIKGQTAFPSDNHAQSALKIMAQIDSQRLNKKLVDNAYIGVADEAYTLGYYYLHGVENRLKQNVDYAIYWLKKAANGGNANAQWLLAKIYSNGAYVAKDQESAFFYTRNAARQDNKEAQLVLAIHYLQGAGTEKNLIESLNWAQKSAANGNEDALKFITKYFPDVRYAEDIITPRIIGKDMFDSIDLEATMQKANNGDRNQQFLLGLMYSEGKVVEKDIETGRKWLKMTAENGNLLAATYLADRYMTGTLYEQNYAEAAKYYKIAALAGDDGAQYNLGVIYSENDIFKTDLAESYRWFKMAADNGNTMAQTKIKELY